MNMDKLAFKLYRQSQYKKQNTKNTRKTIK